MAINAAPFALKNVGVDADVLRQAVASLVPNTGGLVQSGDLAVTQTGTPSMAVSVGVGRAWLPGNNISNVSGQTYSTQGSYFAINDAAYTVTISAANATNPRIDVIYIAAVDTQYGGASDIVKLDKVTGTPAATPAVPAVPANAIALARVAVAANAPSIVTANITTVSSQVVQPRIIPHAGARMGTSTTGVSKNLDNSVYSPIIQAGSVVTTLDASGYGSIDFPVPFPNGIMSTVFINGDSAATGRDKIISIASAPFTNTTSRVYLGVVNGSGAIYTPGPIRIEYIAVGW